LTQTIEDELEIENGGEFLHENGSAGADAGGGWGWIDDDDVGWVLGVWGLPFSPSLRLPQSLVNSAKDHKLKRSKWQLPNLW
jgi:hypothetical protein